MSQASRKEGCVYDVRNGGGVGSAASKASRIGVGVRDYRRFASRRSSPLNSLMLSSSEERRKNLEKQSGPRRAEKNESPLGECTLRRLKENEMSTREEAELDAARVAALLSMYATSCDEQSEPQRRRCLWR